MSQVRSYPTDHSAGVYRKSINDVHHHQSATNHPSHHNKEHPSIMSIRGGPPMSNTRTSLPQIQSKFDLEPNPFEQSFKDNPTESAHNPQAPNTNSPSLDHLLNASRPRKARSTSPTHFSSENRLSPPVIRHTPGGSTVKVSLPGINSIASPAILVHHTGTSTPKSLSPPSLSSSSQLVQSSLASMPPYNWNFGGLGDSLRAGPLSPALLNGPAPVRAGNSVSHTGLAPLADLENNNNNGNGTITPGTQALIAILSANDQNTNDIRNVVGQTSLASTELNSTGHSSLHQVNRNLVNPADQNAGSTSSINPSSNPESLGSAVHRSRGPTFSSIDSTSKASSSTRQDHSQPSTSTNHSPPSSSPQTQDQCQGAQVPPRSTLAPLSVVPVNDPSTSPPSSAAHLKRDSSSNSCIQSSMASSVGRAGVTNLHSVSPLALAQSTISSIGSFSCSATSSRSPFPQHQIPLTIPPAPPLQPPSEIVTPSSPTSTPRNLMNSLPSGSVDRINDQYSTNPLYLLTVAHEASSRMSQLCNPRDSHQYDSMDDATATAAAALTGLGSSGGSRYSSPGPTINPNGSINAHLINSIHNAQSTTLKHAEAGSSVTSPRLPSQRLSTLSDSSSLPPGLMLCSENGVNLLSTHHGAPCATDATGVHSLNGLLPQASSSGSGSTTHMQFQSSYSNHPVGPIVSMNMTNTNPTQQSFSALGISATKKKGKKRKDNAQAAFEDSQKTELQSSPTIEDLSMSRGASKIPRTGRPTQKVKKSKKSKMDDFSGDDSDSRDGYWGTEEDKAFMKQQEGEEGEFGGYSGHTQMPSNYDPDQLPTAAQSSASGKPETEEEKRKNFLERNRQAALKCRQRKKAWLANLQTKVEYLSTENESLQLTINQLREEIDSFRSILVSHKNCPINVGAGRGASTTIGELVGREPGLVAASAAAILAQQQHNGGRTTLRHSQAPNPIHPSTHVSGTLATTNGSIVQAHHTSHGTITSSYGY